MKISIVELNIFPKSNYINLTKSTFHNLNYINLQKQFFEFKSYFFYSFLFLFLFLKTKNKSLSMDVEDPPEELIAVMFPKTLKEFERAEVLSTALVQIDLVRWIDEMKHIIESDSNREMFLIFTETMRNSYINTGSLYRVQAAINRTDRNIANSNFVTLENVYYDTLFKAHKFWTTITLQF